MNRENIKSKTLVLSLAFLLIVTVLGGWAIATGAQEMADIEVTIGDEHIVHVEIIYSVIR